MLRRLAVLLAAASVLVVIACSQSDPGITTAVKSRLAADDAVKAYQIDVDTSDRVVTLTGTVATSTEREQAVMLARQTDGVRDVVDQLSVSPTAATTGAIDDLDRAARDEAREAGEAAGRFGQEAEQEAREAADAARDAGREAARETGQAVGRAGELIEDAAVTTAVKTKFLADQTIKGLQIDVDTRDGIVTLNGTVSTKAEADRAVLVASDTDGVKRVVNNLRVRR
jgi:osmotically-inducible protein OsmY